MPNAINNVKDVGSIIAKMGAKMFADQVQFIKSIDKEDVSTFGSYNGYQAGDTINISKPARFTMGTSADITSTIQDVVEEKVPLALDKQRNVPVALTSAEIATDLALKSWAKRILEPAVSGLAQGVESEVLGLAKNAVFNSVGTAGSTVFDARTFLSANQKIDEMACPDFENRFVLINPAANTSSVDNLKGLFNPNTDLARQYRSGYMGDGLGFTALRNNMLPLHTNGNDVTGVAVESSVLTPATGATQLGVDGLTADTGTVTAGSVFTIAGVNAVHPITKANLGYLQQFTVTANATANSSGQATLSITPTIYSSASGSLQNVSALPADEAALVFVGVASTGYIQNLAYHKSAFRFVSVPLVMPDGVDMVGQETVDGITMRVLRDYNSLTDKMILRLDVLYGFCAVRPEWAVRITA
jgi:hypothetical protein